MGQGEKQKPKLEIDDKIAYKEAERPAQTTGIDLGYSTKTLGDLVRETRKHQGLSIKEVAERAAISIPYLRKIEKGLISNPSFSIVTSLGKVLNIPLEKLSSTVSSKHQDFFLQQLKSIRQKLGMTESPFLDLLLRETDVKTKEAILSSLRRASEQQPLDLITVRQAFSFVVSGSGDILNYKVVTTVCNRNPEKYFARRRHTITASDANLQDISIQAFDSSGRIDVEPLGGTLHQYAFYVRFKKPIRPEDGEYTYRFEVDRIPSFFKAISDKEKYVFDPKELFYKYRPLQPVQEVYFLVYHPEHFEVSHIDFLIESPEGEYSISSPTILKQNEHSLSVVAVSDIAPGCYTLKWQYDPNSMKQGGEH